MAIDHGYLYVTSCIGLKGSCSPTHGLSRRRRVSPRRTGSAQSAGVASCQCPLEPAVQLQALLPATVHPHSIPFERPDNQFVVLHGHRQSCSQCGWDPSRADCLRWPMRTANGATRTPSPSTWSSCLPHRHYQSRCPLAGRQAGTSVKEIHKEHLGQRLKKRKSVPTALSGDR